MGASDTMPGRRSFPLKSFALGPGAVETPLAYWSAAAIRAHYLKSPGALA